MKPVEERLRELFDGELTVLENTRFNPGETANDAAFARELADDHDLFVEDAFGSVHRAHASTVGVAELLPAYAGLLLERELTELGKLLGEVERPFVLVVRRREGRGQARRSAQPRRQGRLRAGWRQDGGGAPRRRTSFRSRSSSRATSSPRPSIDSTDTEIVPYDRVPPGSLGFDIGPETRARFAARIAEARTVFWNGPMGVFE